MRGPVVVGCQRCQNCPREQLAIPGSFWGIHLRRAALEATAAPTPLTKRGVSRRMDFRMADDSYRKIIRLAGGISTTFMIKPRHYHLAPHYS